MSKITLNDVGNLQDTTTSATTINDNNDTLVFALDNTLSRDGTSPNQMLSNLDMNSHRIINLPAPINGSEAIRLSDATAIMDDAIAEYRAASEASSNGLGIRTRLQSTLAIYVSPTGSNSNTGFSVGSPFQTIEHAWNFIRDNYDLNGHDSFILLAAGTYAPANLVGIPIGLRDADSIIIQGDNTTPSNCIISGSGTSALVVGNSLGALTRVGLTGIKLQVPTGSASSGHCLETHAGSSTSIGSTIEFGTSVGNHIWQHTGGYIRADIGCNLLISGNCQRHIFGAENGVMSVHGITVTFSNAPTFSEFIYGGPGCVIVYDGQTFVNANTVTGSKFRLDGGTIITGTTNLDYLPGSTAGQFNAGIYTDTEVWTAYTPSFVSGVGTLGTHSASGRWRIHEGNVEVEITGLITTNGTGSSSLVFGLPITPGSSRCSIMGFDTVLNKTLHGKVFDASPLLQVTFYDGTYPGANTTTYKLNGYYSLP